MKTVDASPDTADHAAIVAHLERTTPLLTSIFGKIPVMYTTYPDGFSAPAVFHRTAENAPASIETISAATLSAEHRYFVLSEHNVTWLARGRYAVELQSWSPAPADPQGAAFARITLERNGASTQGDLLRAAGILRARLQDDGLQAIPLRDGAGNLALWIPLDGAPRYEVLAPWMRSFADAAIRAQPALLTDSHLRKDRGDRIFIGVITNHVGMGTILPYQIRGHAGLPVTVPTRWDDIATSPLDGVPAAHFDAWLHEHGDLFTTLRREIGSQSLPAGAPATAADARANAIATLIMASGVSLEPVSGGPAKNDVIAAALAVLADGEPHTADEILAAGIKRGLLAAATSRKHVYTDIYEYIARTQGLGRVPDIVQDAVSKAFRLNRAADAWPAIALAPLPAFIDDATIDALCARLASTATGTDPAAFEIAVCDAFAALGFSARHYGGHGEPDGTLDAPLGVAGYRVVLECKTASPGGIVSNPRAEEPDGFRAGYHAELAALVGPAFGNEASFNAELTTHRVSCWTVDDVVAMLRAQADPHELEAAFAPGHARDACNALLWEREHGRRKRIACIARAIMQTGWQTQASFAGHVDRTVLPAMTRDAIAILVDYALVQAGVDSGAEPAEFDAALAALSADGFVVMSGGSFVVTRPGTHAAGGMTA